ASQRGDGFANMLRLNVARLRGVAGEQRSIANEVDQSWNAMRSTVDLPDRAGAKANLPPRARDIEPVMDVTIRLLFIEIGERAPDRDTLIELGHLRRANLVEELGLSDEHDLNELFLIGLEIRQDANLLEEFRCEVLCLVEDRDAALAE